MTSFPEEYNIAGGINGHFDDVESFPAHPLSQTATLNGHSVTSNVSQDPKIEQYHSVASKALSSLSQEQKLAVGLILIAGAVVAFIALSPKLLALAIAVTAVAAAIGIVVLASMLYTGTSKTSKNKDLTKPAYPKEFQTYIRDDFTLPLSYFLANPSIPEDKREKLQKILGGIATFLTSDPLAQNSIEDKIDEFRDQFVSSLIGEYPNYDENLDILIKSKIDDANITKIRTIINWLIFSHEHDAKTENFAPFKKEIIKHLYEALTVNPKQIPLRILDDILNHYDQLLQSRKPYLEI